MMGTNATYRMQGRVVLRRIGPDCLLVPVAGAAAQESCVFPLNETGAFIWERLNHGESVGDVAGALAKAFAVSPVVALADCREYADELVAQQLLEVVVP